MSSIQNQPLLPYADNFIPVLRPGAPVSHKHTPEQPFCSDRACPCHENDTESINKVQQWYLEGIITADDATDLIMGRKAW